MARRTYAQDQGIDTSALDELFLGILQSRRDQAGKLAALAAQDKLAATRQRQELEDRKTLADIEHQNRLALEAQKQTDEFTNKESEVFAKSVEQSEKDQKELDKAMQFSAVVDALGGDPRIPKDLPPREKYQRYIALYGEDVIKNGMANAENLAKSTAKQLAAAGDKADVSMIETGYEKQNPDLVTKDVAARRTAAELANIGTKLSNQGKRQSNAVVPLPTGSFLMNQSVFPDFQQGNVTLGRAPYSEKRINPKTLQEETIEMPAVPSQLKVFSSPNEIRAAEDQIRAMDEQNNVAEYGMATRGVFPSLPASAALQGGVAAPQVVPSTAQRQPVGGLVGLGQQAIGGLQQYYADKMASPFTVGEGAASFIPSMISEGGAALGNLGAQALVGRSPFMMMTQPNMVKTVNGWIPAAENLVDPRVRRPFSYR